MKFLKQLLCTIVVIAISITTLNCYEKEFVKAEESLGVGSSVYFGRYLQEKITDEEVQKRLYWLMSPGEYKTIDGVNVYCRGSWSNPSYYMETPIQWRILGERNGAYILLSEKVIDSRTFSSGTGWPSSEIRNWLNGDFYNSSFYSKEKKDINSTTLDNVVLNFIMGDGYYKKNESTVDKVWLLDEHEIVKSEWGFSESTEASESRMAKTTQYVDDNESYSNWFLRGEPYWFYYNGFVGKYVEKNGSLHKQGGVLDGSAGGNYSQGIRPVICVKKNSEYLSTNKTAVRINPKHIPNDNDESDPDESDEEHEIKIGQEVRFDVPDDIPLIGGGEVGLDFDNIPIQFKMDGSTFKLGVGTRNLAKADEGEWCNFKKFVETQKESIKKGLSILEKTKKGTADFAWNYSPEINCFGYLEGTIKDNKVQSSEGKMVIEVKTKASKEVQYICVVPIVVKINAEVGVKAEMGVGLDFEKSQCYTKGTYTLTLPKIKPSVGIGIAHIADVSIYGSAKNEVKITSKNLSRPDVKATLSGEIGVSAKALCAKFSKKIISGSKVYYDNSNHNNKSAAINERKANNSSINEESYVVERTNNSSWENETTDSDEEQNVVMRNVYDAAEPKIVKTESGKKVLIYTLDINNRQTGNHTAVVYSTYDENSKTWSNPEIIDDDGTADYYPSVAVDGEKVYVAWSNSKSKIDYDENDDGFIESASAKLDIALGTIDLSNNSTSTRELSDDEKLEYKTSVAVIDGKVYVGWIKNLNNDIINMSGENQLYIADISSDHIYCYEDNLNPVTSLAIGELEDEVCIAFAESCDEDIQETDQVVVHEGDLEGRIIDAEYGEIRNIKFANVLGENRILCYQKEYKESRIVSSDYMGGIYDTLVSGVNCSPDYDYFGDDKTGLFVFSDDAPNGNGTEIYASVISEREGSELVKITNNNKYSHSISGIEENGKYILSYVKSSVNMDDDINESSDLCVSTYNPISKLDVESVDYNPDEFKIDEPATVFVKIKNEGLLNEKNYILQAACNERVVGEHLILGSVKPGEEREESIKINLSEEFLNNPSMKINLLSPDDEVIASKELNEDFSKSDLQLSLSETNKDVNILVSNETLFDCSAKLYVKDSDKNGKVYKTYDIGNVGGNASYSMSIEKEELRQFEKADVNLFFELVSEDGELYYSNNTAFLFLQCQHQHTHKEILKASPNNDGSIKLICDDCGAKVLSKKIPRINKIKLSYNKCIYDGKNKKPGIVVEDSAGNIIDSINYKVDYKNNKNVGRAVVSVLFYGDAYTGSINESFLIYPQGSMIKKIISKNKRIIVKWKKVSNNSGYQIQYSLKKNFAKSKIVTIKKSSTTKTTIRRLKKKKKYYVRIRTYKTVNGEKYYSEWSKTKTKKTK